MDAFLKELQKLSEKHGITLKQPIVNEKIDFFRQLSSLTSTGFSETFSTYHVQELWAETTKELSVRFIKKTRARVR